MPSIGLIQTFLREIFAIRTLNREPEGDLVMDDAVQVAAYAEAGRIDGVMAAAYLFHSARISQTIQGCKSVVDLGCGPATQLAQIAQLNPDVQFVGVDLSEAMLSDARAHVDALGLKNVNFRSGDITRLDAFSDQSADGVISTMALHHLPTLQHLDACFGEIRRVVKPGGALYLADFGRLKSIESVRFFADMNAAFQPELFSLDYERSLRAAFLHDEFRALSARNFTSNVRVHSTFRVPFLVLIKTADKTLPDALRQRFTKMAKSLKPRYRSDLSDMRMFFALGGLRNDPFH